jgi:hypothetical protein
VLIEEHVRRVHILLHRLLNKLAEEGVELRASSPPMLTVVEGLERE